MTTPTLKDLAAKLDQSGLGGLLGGRSEPARPAPEREPPEGVRPVWEGADAKGHPHRLTSDGRTFLAYEVAARRASCGEPLWESHPLPFLPEAEATVASALAAATKVEPLAMAMRTVATGQLHPSDGVQFVSRTLVALGLDKGPTVPVAPRPPAPRAPSRPAQSTAYELNVVDWVRDDERLIVVVRSKEPPRPGDLITFSNGQEGRVGRVNPKEPGSFDVHLPPGQVMAPGEALGRREVCSVDVVLGATVMTLTVEGDVLRIQRNDVPGDPSLTTVEGDGLRFSEVGPAGLKVLAQLAYLVMQGERIAKNGAMMPETEAPR